MVFSVSDNYRIIVDGIFTMFALLIEACVMVIHFMVFQLFYWIIELAHLTPSNNKLRFELGSTQAEAVKT